MAASPAAAEAWRAFLREMYLAVLAPTRLISDSISNAGTIAQVAHVLAETGAETFHHVGINRAATRA